MVNRTKKVEMLNYKSRLATQVPGLPSLRGGIKGGAVEMLNYKSRIANQAPGLPSLRGGIKGGAL
jgi:hypothetical protein